MPARRVSSPAISPPDGPKLRLLEVVVQAVVVIDDGETLTKQAAHPVTISAADWPTFATEGFAASFEALRQQVEGPPL